MDKQGPQFNAVFLQKLAKIGANHKKPSGSDIVVHPSSGFVGRGAEGERLKQQFGPSSPKPQMMDAASNGRENPMVL